MSEGPSTETGETVLVSCNTFGANIHLYISVNEPWETHQEYR